MRISTGRHLAGVVYKRASHRVPQRHRKASPEIRGEAFSFFVRFRFVLRITYKVIEVHFSLTNQRGDQPPWRTKNSHSTARIADTRLKPKPTGSAWSATAYIAARHFKFLQFLWQLDITSVDRLRGIIIVCHDNIVYYMLFSHFCQFYSVIFF